MDDDRNRRETGATKYPVNTGPDPADQFSQDAAENEKPREGMGLTRRQGEVEDKTRQSEGRNPPRRPNPATGKSSGAGSVAVEHSGDAKAHRRGRQPGAHVAE
ncbi:hypothetical protein LCM4577_08225 [Mesorhizobium sp. LCM 4577]|uniref:hypothetical protein n=1 Tax=unclassified Mesorhizobium TaxID=325217 RepID=UPI000595AB80|nr:MULTISPECIES: hypothetical protein [unclassified Mesorhizobium]OHV66043.1 hypothetical protein LCM4577_08225 [Mesorhizobium sp. LCM 4577]OHV74585.1 hypothetical protein LCM4576_13895 [Mesorhizobium sp. LCM 4576]